MPTPHSPHHAAASARLARDIEIIREYAPDPARMTAALALLLSYAPPPPSDGDPVPSADGAAREAAHGRAERAR